MPILSQPFLSFMRCNLMTLSLFTARQGLHLLITVYSVLNCWFTNFFRSEDALNTGAVRSGTCITLPVLGFREIRSFRLTVRKLPNPRMVTVSPVCRAYPIVAKKPSITAEVSILVKPVPSATISMISPLVKTHPSRILMFVSSQAKSIRKRAHKVNKFMITYGLLQIF